VATTVDAAEPVEHDVHWEYLVPITTVHLLAVLVLLPWCFSSAPLGLTSAITAC
jgi:hypothetical protein